MDLLQGPGQDWTGLQDMWLGERGADEQQRPVAHLGGVGISERCSEVLNDQSAERRNDIL